MELEKAVALLRKARDILAFDQFPGEAQCVEMKLVWREIVDFLGGEEDEWTKTWKATMLSIAESRLSKPDPLT